MRKCPACGYLLMGEGDACKHCGAPLPSVAAGVLVPASAAPAASPVPPVPPVPPPVTYAAPPPPPPPVAPAPPDPYGAYPPPPDFGRAPVAREYWTPPTSSVTTKRPRSTPRFALTLISIASMALGWTAVGHVFNRDPLPSGTSAFVAGHGLAYSSPDHTFDARFPLAPTIEQRQIPVGESSATMNLAQVQTDDYEVVAGSMVMPVAFPADRAGPALHTALRDAIAAEGAKVSTEQDITEDGVPGVEMHATVKDGYPARFMMLASGTHLYFLGVHSKHATQRLYDALRASLILY